MNARGVRSNGAEGAGRLTTQHRDRHPLPETVLRLMWREKVMSRAEIARRLGLSRSTVSELMKQLLRSGLIKEVGSGASSGGRRPILIEFQHDARVIVGVDIGATHVRATVIDLLGRQLVTEERPHPVRRDPEGTRSLVFDITESCLNKVEGGLDRLLSIGVALPSPVDPEHPEWLSEIVIPAWQGRTELDRLKEHFGVPVYVDNDANLGALAELLWGAGRGVDDLCYLKVSYGVGAGFILHGEIYRGAGGVAGEMGHMSVDPQGPQCICGLKGCLVTLVGGAALEQKLRELLPDHPRSQLVGSEPDIDKLQQAAIDGDPLATKLIQESAKHLGRAIASWINMLNPGRIIMGGSMARLGDSLLGFVRQEVDRCNLVNGVYRTEIRIAELGDLAESVGAAALALEAVFSEPGFYQNMEPNEKPSSADVQEKP